MHIEIADIAPLRRSYLTRIKPNYCTFPVIGLPWQVTPFDTCEVARQTHSLAGALIHLFEVEASSAVKINLNVQGPHYFLFFCCQDQLVFMIDTTPTSLN